MPQLATAQINCISHQDLRNLVATDPSRFAPCNNDQADIKELRRDSRVCLQDSNIRVFHFKKEQKKQSGWVTVWFFDCHFMKIQYISGSILNCSRDVAPSSYCLINGVCSLAATCIQEKRTFTVARFWVLLASPLMSWPVGCQRTTLGLLANVQHCISYWNSVSFFELSPDCSNLSASESKIKWQVFHFFFLFFFQIKGCSF